MPHRNVFAEEAVFKDLATPIEHSARSYGYDIDGDGLGIKIAIVDTGKPDHLSLTPDVKILKRRKESDTSPDNSINLSESHTVNDTIGQSTIVGGIIGANDTDRIVGMAPNAELYYAKICDDDGKITMNGVVSAFLWSIIKGVDIIVMPMTLDVHSDILKDTVIKAVKNNVCVVCSAGFYGYEQYPTSYKGVLSVGAQTQQKERAGFSALGKVNAVGTSICSTYVNQDFCVAKGSAIATAVIGGLTALVAGEMKAKGQLNPIDVYSRVEALTQGTKNAI